MPDIKSNNQKIYDYLSSQNVKNIGANADEFQQKMSDDGNRRKVFDFLNSKKVKNIGANYDEFASLVYDGGQQQEAAPSPLAPQEQEQAQQAAPAQPVAQDNSKWAVPQASQWGDQMDELGKSVMPGKPVSMPEKKPAAPAEPEPDANPFPSRGGLEKEKEDLEGQLEEIRATIDRDYSFSKEYDERNKAYKEQLKKLTDIKYAGNDFSGIDAEKKWLKENEGKFGENKGEYDDLKRRAAEIETQIRIIKQEQNKAALKAQKEENQRYVAPITTSSGGMAPGYDPSYAQKRGNMVQSEQYRMANEIIDSTEQVYGQGDKEDPGLKGNLLERVGTANQQFWVQGVLNNIDSGTFSGGATKGAAFTYARNVADKRTKIANDTLKELGRTDEDINRIAKEISEDGQKLEPIIGQLNAADEELKSMKATIDDMTANGDPNVNTYIAEYNKKVDAYQKIYDEYAPVFERYKKNYDDYKVIESAIKAASQKGMTDGERAVLDAFDAYNEAQDLRNGNVSVWSSSGAAAEQSAEFILDFIITKGFDKVGAKAAKKLASARWLKPLGEKGTKAAAKFLSDMEVAALRTGSLFPRNLQSYSENLIQMTGGPDELGRYHFDRSHLNAALNTALTQYIEYWSEGFGEYFGAGEQALFRKATSLAPYTAIGKTLNQYRGSIGKYLDYGKFDGMFNEMLEEVVGSTLNSLFGWMSGDKVGDADAMKEFFAGEQLATLALSFLPMSAISANTNIRAYGKMRERYEKGANMLESFVKEGRISREELDNLVSNLSEMTPEQATKRIVEIGQKVKGRLPMDYAQNMIGYLEGSYAMSLRHDEWEESQEKMDIMGAYTATYSNPGMGNAWDLAQGEQSARTTALNAGFTEEELDQNAFILGQEAKDMKDTDSRRAEILLNYATAKAAKNGLHDRYDADITKVEETFDADVRENFDNDGIVMTATLPINGRNEVVFIKTKDAKITPEGTLTTPTGEDGLIEYRNVNGGAVRTAKANMFSNADVQLTDVFINEQNEKFRRSSEERFANAEKTISLSGQSRAINDRVGQNVIVDDHNGVYEPFKVERMDDDGASVVISGERKSLQGVARAMGMEIPGGKYLKAPVAKLYPILAKEPDGVTLTTGLDETRNQNQNQTTNAPAEGQAPQTAEQQAPAQEAEAVQAPELGDLRGQTVQFMDKDGAVKNANVLSNADGWVVFEELNDNGEVVGTGTMRDADFAQAMQAAATPAPAGEAQTPVVEETPVQEPVVEETPAEQGFPVDENGNRVFDHPSVTPEMAMAELYNGIEPGTKNAANRKKYIDGKANAAIAEVTEAENKIAGLQAKKAMVDEWDINDGEELDAFEQRKAAEKKKFDDEIAQIEAGLPELQRKASHWSAVRDMAEQFGQAPAEAQEAPAQEQQPTANREIQRTEEEEAERGEANSIPRKLARRLKRWQKRTGIKVHVCYSMDDVRDQDAKEAMTSETDRRILTGSFDPNTGTVEIYLFNIDDEAELDRSFIHEVVSHKGLRELLGEEGYNELCDRVWDELMTDGDKQYFTGYNRHLEAVDDAQRRAAADEYIARLSENLDFYDNRSIFQKLVDWVKRILGEKLTVGELEYDAKERATGATASMSDDVLRVILSDSMKRYVETTRGGQKDAKDKAEISSEVGGSIETDAGDNRNGQTRFSMKSIVNGGGLDVIENDGKGNVAFVTTDGRTFNAEHPITARDLMGLENTVMFHMMKDAREISHIDSQKEMRIWQAYADQLNAFLQKGVAKDGLEGADRLKALWQWEVENSVYRSVAPNSDEQYKYSLDITRVCKKNEATIRAISAMQRKLGAGLTPGQVMDVYMAGIEEGYQVPCPVCYVFSRYINNGIVATIAINGQKKWGNLLVDPSTLSEEENRERITMWKRLLDEQEAFNEKNKKQIEQAKKDCSSIIDEIDDLSYQISSGKLKGKERTAAEKRVKLLDNRYRAAFDLVSQSALTQWIKQFAIRQTKNGYAPTADGKKYELWDDTFQGFPDEYALDLRLTAETIEKYPAIQRLRKARGAAGGKEIHFASNNDVGDIPMMLGADNSVNFYQKAVNARTKKERDYFLSKATERFKNAHKYAQQQSLRGGQRMWSWSDNIERLAPDVFVNLLQLQMLGGALQSYSKQLEGVNLVANLQGYVNGSLMGYGKGWTELQPEDIKVVDGKEVLAHDIKDTVTEKVNGQDVKRERYLAKEGSPVITVDGKKVTLLFDDVVGIDPYGRDVDGKHLKGLFDLNSELDKAGNILVGMNDTHIIAAMADDRVFFIIPWHASGNSIHQVQQMLNGLGVKTMVKDYMDYTKVQEEKDMDKKKKKKSEEESDFVDEEVDVSKEEKIEDAEPIREEIIEFWENHKNEKDYKCGLGSIPSGKDGKLSTEQKRYRKLRDAIFDGLFDELPEKDRQAIMNDAFLSQVLRKVNQVVDDKEMTAGDKKFIYPYEYWDESSTYDNADMNGARYLEYCRRLGYKPKFVGKLDRKAKTDFGNFADYKGYWKLLIDRRMYDVNGRFQDLDPVTTDNYDPRTVDPEWTAENFPLTTVADDPGAERIADRAIEKEGRTFKGGVPTANYEGDIQSAVKKYEMVSKLVDLKPAKPKKSKKKGTQFRDVSDNHEANADPQVSEGGVTMFRERTAPAPQKTQKVYKLMRLSDDGNLYPLFIDRDAEPIKLGTWYDADSPDMEFLKKMPSGVFLVDTQNGTYTSLEDYKNERGEKVTKLPGIADVEEAAKNGLRWMKITDTERAQRRYEGENRKYENIGINGSEGVSTFAMRPGWHAGSLPTMRQIGKGAEKNLRDDKFVWVEGEISADKDYNEEAQGNPDKDIPTHIPTDGFYMKATNANKKASQADRVGWYVAGAFKPNRIMSDSETRRVIDAWNAEHQDAPVEYDWPRESGKVFNAETMQLEDENPEPEGPNGGGSRFRERITPEQDKEYMDAVNSGDMEKAGQMVRDAFKAAFPNTKVVDENGEPLVVWRVGKTDGYNVFDENRGGNWRGFYFTNRDAALQNYATGDTGESQIRAFFLDSKNPYMEDNFNVLQGDKQELIDMGYDGMIFAPDGIDARNFEVKVFEPSQIKSADPVTYDDNGNVIPLSERFNPEKRDIRFRDVTNRTEERAKEAVRKKELDARFNRQLGFTEQVADYYKKNGKMPENYIPATYRLGTPFGSLLVSGMKDVPIQMREDNLLDISANGPGFRHDYHQFDLSELKDLASLINNPIAVIRSGRNGFGLLLDRKDKNGNDYYAYLRGHETPGSGVDRYDIISIYPVNKGGKKREILEQIIGEKDDLAWADTKKITSWVNGKVSNLRSYYTTTQEVVANIRKKFGNKQDLLRIDAENLRPVRNSRFREAPSTGNAQLDYENEIRRVTTQYLLEWQDGDIPVRIAMNKVMAEVGMDHISDDMDYLTRHNLASSIADAQMHQYKLFYYEPMMKTVSEIVDKLLGRKFNIIEKLTGQKRAKQDEIYNDLVNFCYAMSGLERNAWKRAEAAEKMRKELEKLAEKWEKESEAINADSRLSEEERVRKLASSERRYLKEREEIEAKYAPRDYSGITGLMGRPADEWQEAEADAQNMVDAFRERLGDDKKIDELWDRIRACTDFNLEHAYKYGLLSRTEYEKLHGTESQPRLWNFYLPLRGFAEATAEEEYSYSMFTSDLAGGDVVKEAKGRVTEADDPFATIRHISEQELIQGVNNWAKQALYNFVLRAGKNTLLTPVEPWYVKEAGSDKWAPAEPREDETLEQFESRMQEAYKKGDARRGRNGLNLNLIMGNPMHRNQHMIRLKINGQEKMIWVNGSAIMAQAVNGVHGWDNKVVQKWRALNRSLSQFYTTYSARFLTKNKQRDTQFSRIAALVDEGQAYLTELEKNWWANNGYVAGGYPMIVLVSEWNSGKLEQKEHRTEKEQMFIDFMYDGGATGYTMRNTMEQIKRDLEKMVKNAGSAESNIPVISWYTKGISALNEASELLTRFTFYETSRKMGRSRQRAAYDAKESSVNFNRRGLRSGKGVAGWTAAAASMLYLFMNPAIQGLDRFFRLHKSHPWSMGLVDATYFAMGFFNSMMNAMLAGMSDGGDGDDDDKKMGPDWYWNIPEWVRRSNMIIASPFKKLGKWGYLVIALPIEYKAFYAMGELASSIFQRKYTAKDAKTLTNEVIGVVAELLPINPVEGYTPGDNPAMSVLRNIAPDAIAPIIDVATNRSFAGIPLWKENVYDETMPLSQSAFASTPEILNKAVIKLAEASADWPYHIDIPSGAVRGILKGYGGGAYTFVEDTGKFIFADDAHPRRYENFPFISGFSGYLEEDRRNTFNSNALNRYKQLSKDFVKYVRMAAPGEDIDESAVYNNPDELPAKAQTYITLHKDAWILGQMYYEGMKEKSGATTTKVDKRGNVRTVTVKDDLKTLRSEWTKKKNEYARIAKDKNSTDAEKEEAEKAMNKAWLRYLDSEDALVDRLINEEYFHIKQKVENGIPYDPPKDTWSERLYNWTNK